MSADIIQSDYEQLEEVAVRFGQSAVETKEMGEQVRRAMHSLQQGGWEGSAAAAFFQEMEGDVLPKHERLIHALQESQRVTRLIIEIIREAEEEAAQPFRQGGAPGGIPGGGIPGGAGPGGAGPGGTGGDPFITVGEWIGSGGNIFNVIDGARNMYRLYDSLYDPLTGMKDFLTARTSFSGAFSDMFKTKWGAAGTLLNVVGAGFESYADYQAGQGIPEIAVSESIELVLDVGIHALAYTNPISGAVMLTYDIASLVVPDEYWIDMDEATDWVGNQVYAAGEYVWDNAPRVIDGAVDAVDSAVDAVSDFGAGIVDGIGSLF